MTALTDHDDDSNSTHSHGDQASPPDGDQTTQDQDQQHHVILPEETEAIIDRILRDHDADSDGYLTYAEMLMNEKGILNNFDQPDDGDTSDNDDDDPPRPDGSQEPDPAVVETEALN